MKRRTYGPAMLWKICYHEAGHAVANHDLGYDFVDIEVFDRPTDDCGGRTNYDPDKMIKRLAEGTINLAGPTAECHYLKLRFKKPNLVAIWLTHGHTDQEQAFANAKGLARRRNAVLWGRADDDLGYEEFFTEMLRDAEQMVARRWLDIGRVAVALFERRRLSHAEFLDVLAP